MSMQRVAGASRGARKPRAIVGATLFSVALLVAAGAQAAVARSPYRAIAYDFGASSSPAETQGIRWSPPPPAQVRELDAIIFAFAFVDDGRVVLGDTAARRLDSLVALKRHNPHLQVDLSVGGWGTGGFSEAAGTEGGRKLFAASATSLVVAHRLDGLDIDWEFPGSDEARITASPDDERNFTLLLAAVRSSLAAAGAADGHTYTLSVAAGIGADLRHTNLAAINGYVDWFNVMTYDECNKEPPGVHLTCHHSGLYATPATPAFIDTIDRAVWQFLVAGVPAHKLVIGAAFYGHAYGEVRPEHSGLFQPHGEAPDAGELPWPTLQADYIGKAGFVRQWDPIAHAPWLWNAQTRTFITYDDPESLAAKAAYVKANHLGGIMFWQLGMDPTGELLHALRQGLDAGAATTASTAGN